MKRFWTAAAAVKVPAGWGVELDGKALNTPAKAPLAVPTRALGEAIAAEWQDAGEDCEVDDDERPERVEVAGVGEP